MDFGRSKFCMLETHDRYNPAYKMKRILRNYLSVIVSDEKSSESDPAGICLEMRSFGRKPQDDKPS